MSRVSVSKSKARAKPKPAQPKYIDSSAELAYMLHLQAELAAGAIQSFYLKPGSLRLGEVRYNPDFLVIQLDGTLEYHEVKSNHRYASKGIAKLKMFAGHFHDLRFILVMVGGRKGNTVFNLQEIQV